MIHSGVPSWNSVGELLSRWVLPDDNEDNQRHTIPAIRHRQPTLVVHPTCATVGYGSEGPRDLRAHPAASAGIDALVAVIVWSGGRSIHGSRSGAIMQRSSPRAVELLPLPRND